MRALEQENLFLRGGIEPLPNTRPLLLGEVGIFQLINAFQNVLKRVEAREELQQIFGENYTVSDKIETILPASARGWRSSSRICLLRWRLALRL